MKKSTINSICCAVMIIASAICSDWLFNAKNRFVQTHVLRPATVEDSASMGMYGPVDGWSILEKLDQPVYEPMYYFVLGLAILYVCMGIAVVVTYTIEIYRRHNQMNFNFDTVKF